MKLHRIQTLNLNSLYGEQEVDFDASRDQGVAVVELTDVVRL